MLIAHVIWIDHSSFHSVITKQFLSTIDEVYMDRRQLFRFFTLGSAVREETPSDSNRPKIQAGIEPYSPALDRQKAYHLLRRLTFAPTVSLANQLIGKTSDQAVELLLGNGAEPPPTEPGAWIHDGAQDNPKRLIPELQGAVESTLKSQLGLLLTWWMNLMHTETNPSREKITLFWSGHWVSEFAFDDLFNPPPTLYIQNTKFRNMRFGTFGDLAEALTIDSAMLNYLGGNVNIGGKPNENYGRELLELFTTGIGWYTEGDVKEASRVLTGWKSSLFRDEKAPNGMFMPFFESKEHDVGAKQFMGSPIASRDSQYNTEVLVRREEIRGLINIILDRRADQVAEFVARKAYRFFVYSSPDGEDTKFIGDLAKVFKDSGFNMRTLWTTLFKSAHFYDEANIGVQIKTPAEFVVGLGRQMGVEATGAGVLTNLEQSLMDAPDVSGWKGYRTWISTKTYPIRRNFAASFINGSGSSTSLVVLLKSLPDYTDINKATEQLVMYFLPKTISAERLTNYKNILLANAPEYEWANILKDNNALGTRLVSFLSAVSKAPDFQLC